MLTNLFEDVGRNPISVGTVTVDTTANNGAGNVTLTNTSEVNATLVLRLCPYPQADTNCFNITSFTTDAHGSANMNFTVPQKGTFAGIFDIQAPDVGEFAATGTGSSGDSFHSALLPAATVTGGIQQTTGHAPGIGKVTVKGTTAHITLTGTTPNHVFNTAVCSVFLVTPCAQLANITTDAQGNVSADVGTVQAAGWSTFRVSDADGVEFVSAFRVQ